MATIIDPSGTCVLDRKHGIIFFVKNKEVIFSLRENSPPCDFSRLGSMIPIIPDAVGGIEIIDRSRLLAEIDSDRPLSDEEATDIIRAAINYNFFCSLNVYC